MNGNKFTTGEILGKPVEVVMGRILAGWAQNLLNPGCLYSECGSRFLLLNQLVKSCNWVCTSVNSSSPRSTRVLGRPRPLNRSIDLNRLFQSDGLGAPGGASQQDEDKMPFRVTTGRQAKIGRLPHLQCAFELAPRCQCHLSTCWKGPQTSFVLHVECPQQSRTWLKLDVCTCISMCRRASKQSTLHANFPNFLATLPKRKHVIVLAVLYWIGKLIWCLTILKKYTQQNDALRLFRSLT
jgi:hypothetical protein